MATGTCLKRGSCGDVIHELVDREPRIVRDLRTARAGCGWIARLLARREARALQLIGAGTEGIPTLLDLNRLRLARSFIPGQAMQAAKPQSPDFYRDALRVLRRVHRAGVAHNDLAKEANWICRAGERAGIVDFQLALCAPRRGRWFRLLAREDLRHLAQHKAHYRPDLLTARQKRLLASPSFASRGWRFLFTPAYQFLTRRLRGWPERDGAAERQRSA
jgi:RIO-like serine/threonine protein kinase